MSIDDNFSDEGKNLTSNEMYNLDMNIDDLGNTTDILDAIERYNNLIDKIKAYEKRGIDMFDYKVEMTKAYHYTMDNNV